MSRNNHANSGNGNNGKEKLDLCEVSELGVLARGEIPWAKRQKNKRYSRLSEVEYAYILSRSGAYIFRDGVMAGKPDHQKIAEELNKQYHSGRLVRDRYSVRNALYKFRTSKQNPTI